MNFRVLGSLEVCDDDGREIALGVGRQRALLAVLLLHANEVVSVDRLIDDLWGELPPVTAAKIVQNHVSQLRRALGEERLVTRAHGYLLATADGDLDLDRFEALVGEGERALEAGDPRRASETLERALDLWRGPPLDGFAYETFAQAPVARLEERRLTALEERIEADLALGRHRELVGELEQLVAEHPLRERLRGQLMLVLYRSGRQADALASDRGRRGRRVDHRGAPRRERARLEDRPGDGHHLRRGDEARSTSGGHRDRRRRRLGCRRAERDADRDRPELGRSRSLDSGRERPARRGLRGRVSLGHRRHEGGGLYLTDVGIGPIVPATIRRRIASTCATTVRGTFGLILPRPTAP